VLLGRERDRTLEHLHRNNCRGAPITTGAPILTRVPFTSREDGSPVVLTRADIFAQSPDWHKAEKS
jgi:hypothetical protein